MRQRYAYGSNIAAVRCGWDVKIKEQWRIKNCGIQSAAVLATLALRALFLGILCPLIASLTLAMTQRGAAKVAPPIF